MRRSEKLDETRLRFNALLLPYLSTEAPSMLDMIGLWKFAAGESDKSRRTRQELLDGALALLREKKNVDLDAVFDTLYEAKQKKVRAYLDGNRTDRRREFDEDKKKELDGLKNSRRFWWHCGDRDYVATLVKMSKKLIRHKWPGPRRRDHAGHQPEPWLRETRLKLSQAQVPKEIGEQLLVAVRLKCDFDDEEKVDTPSPGPR